MSGGKHTIVLVQTTASRATRTFHDYEGIGVAMDGVPLPHPAHHAGQQRGLTVASWRAPQASAPCTSRSSRRRTRRTGISPTISPTSSSSSTRSAICPASVRHPLRLPSARRLIGAVRSVQRSARGVPAVRQGVDQAAGVCAVKTADRWCAVNSRAADIAALCNECRPDRRVRAATAGPRLTCPGLCVSGRPRRRPRRRGPRSRSPPASCAARAAPPPARGRTAAASRCLPPRRPAPRAPSSRPTAPQTPA